MAEFDSWDVAAANNTASPPDGAPEGMAPSIINNVIRENMAVLARKEADENGTLTTAGSATAYTVATPNRALTAYYNGLRLRVKLHTASGAAPTLNVNGLGAVEIRSPVNVYGQLGAGQFPAGAIVELVYGTVTTPGWFIQSGGVGAYDARRTVSTFIGAGAVEMNKTYLKADSGYALTLPAASAQVNGDEVFLLALASNADFTIAPAGSDVIYWSDLNASTGSGTPRGFGGATSPYHRACSIRRIGAGSWYGFVYSSFLS